MLIGDGRVHDATRGNDRHQKCELTVPPTLSTEIGAINGSKSMGIGPGACALPRGAGREFWYMRNIAPMPNGQDKEEAPADAVRSIP